MAIYAICIPICDLEILEFVRFLGAFHQATKRLSHTFRKTPGHAKGSSRGKGQIMFSLRLVKLSTVALPLPDEGQTNFSRLKPRLIEILAGVYSNALALLQHLFLACRQGFLFLQCCRWGLKAFGSLREYSSTRKSVSRSLSKYCLCVLRS